MEDRKELCKDMWMVGRMDEGNDEEMNDATRMVRMDRRLI